MNRRKTISTLIFFILLIVSLEVILLTNYGKITFPFYKAQSPKSEYFSKFYNGFKLYSDINNFTEIENAINQLDIFHSEYPYLKGIYFIHENINFGTYILGETCCGVFHTDAFSVNEVIFLSGKHWKCSFGEYEENQIYINYDNTLERTLAHELGHYHQRHSEEGYSEYLAEQYAIKEVYGEDTLDFLLKRGVYK